MSKKLNWVSANTRDKENQVISAKILDQETLNSLELGLDSEAISLLRRTKTESSRRKSLTKLEATDFITEMDTFTKQLANLDNPPIKLIQELRLSYDEIKVYFPLGLLSTISDKSERVEKRLIKIEGKLVKPPIEVALQIVRQNMKEEDRWISQLKAKETATKFKSLLVGKTSLSQEAICPIDLCLNPSEVLKKISQILLQQENNRNLGYLSESEYENVINALNEFKMLYEDQTKIISENSGLLDGIRLSTSSGKKHPSILLYSYQSRLDPLIHDLEQSIYKNPNILPDVKNAINSLIYTCNVFKKYYL